MHRGEAIPLAHSTLAERSAKQVSGRPDVVTLVAWIVGIGFSIGAWVPIATLAHAWLTARG